MEPLPNQDFVVPHQLCYRCRRLVSEAECLKYNVEDLLPSGFDRDTEQNPIQHVVEMYSSIRDIAQSGNSGCHLCSILSAAVVNGKSRSEIREMFDVERSNVPRIYAVLTLLPYYYRSDAAFDLILNKGKPEYGDYDEYYLNRINERAVVLRRVKNDVMLSCQMCDHCHETPFDDRVLWETHKQFAHYRWTEYTGSETSIHMIEGWLKGCSTEHFACNVNLINESPTRLLDLAGLGIYSDIRLICSTQAQGKRYASLSYCWGIENFFVTTQSNIDAFGHCIKFGSLPKTFQDAVVVCRRLSIAYLWIDALCIVQGAGGDWDSEASRMGSIYAGSILTIAAAQAESSLSGFLHHRSPLRQQDCRLLHDSTHTVLARAEHICDIEGHGQRTCRLDTRGWVLQERLLSPRTLYFGPDGIHWECRRGSLCDRRPFFDLESNADHYVRGKLNVKWIYQALQGLDSIQDRTDARLKFRQCWMLVLKAYSQTILTYDSDKFVAIAGIATVFQSQLDIQASFGLWLLFFPTELLWSIEKDEDGERDIKYRLRHDFAPSWSWASISGGTITNTFIQLAGYGRRRLTARASVETLPSPTTFSRANVLPPVNAPQFAIKIRGMFCRGIATDGWRKDGVMSYIYPASEEVDSEKNLPELVLDTPLNVYTELYCLLLAGIKHENIDFDDRQPMTDLGIVLTPVDSSRTQYRRVGVFQEEVWPRHEGMRMFGSPIPESVIEIV